MVGDVGQQPEARLPRISLHYVNLRYEQGLHCRLLRTRPRNIVIANIKIVPVHYCSSILRSLTAPGLPSLSKIVPDKTHLEATTSRQRRDARPDSFQLLF